jgi:hypothetical protein
MKKIYTIILIFMASSKFMFATVYYVDASKSDNSGSGTSWATAKKDISNAMNLAVINSNDEIWIKAGTYFPTSDALGNNNPTDPRDKTFLIKSGIKFYGGFLGTETSLMQRNANLNITILNGDIGNPNSDVDNCYHVVLTSILNTTQNGVTIDGVTIKGGNADGSSVLSIAGNNVRQFEGGGIYLVNGNSNTINNCVFTNNKCLASGNAIYKFNASNLTITNCFFDVLNSGGSGIYGGGGNLIFSNNVVKSSCNRGLYSFNCTSSTILNNVFYGDGSTTKVSIDFFISSGTTHNVKNCIFYNNGVQDLNANNVIVTYNI